MDIAITIRGIVLNRHGGARWGHYRLFGTAREIFIDTIKSIFIKDK